MEDPGREKMVAQFRMCLVIMGMGIVAFGTAMMLGGFTVGIFVVAEMGKFIHLAGALMVTFMGAGTVSMGSLCVKMGVAEITAPRGEILIV